MSVVNVVLDVPDIGLPCSNYVSDTPGGSSADGKRVFRQHDSHGNFLAFQSVESPCWLEAYESGMAHQLLVLPQILGGFLGQAIRSVACVIIPELYLLGLRIVKFEEY